MMKRNRYYFGWLAALALVVMGSVQSAVNAAADKPNILIMTVDDMSADSLGSCGCKLTKGCTNRERP